MKYYKDNKNNVFAYASDGSQDEYIHSTLTAISKEDADAIVNPPPSLEAQQAAFTAAVQAYLDTFARTRNYDNIMSAATYATSTVPKFAAEGQCAVEARDATWAKGYEIMDEVLSGQRPMPTIEEVIAELPLLAWPELP